MLKSLSLHNFRQHKSLNLNFSDGITVVRGNNEAGKSTLFEAITYALFGVKSCRNNDLSTWGEPENSQKVELVFNAGNKTYTVKRTSRAAELVSDGIIVTGQTEVTKYCEEVLNLKPNTGSKLMFVAQGAMRGILEDGGAKTTQMIEALADFDMVETWIETLQESFQTGRTDTLEYLLKNTQEQIDVNQDKLLTLPDPNKVKQQEKEKYEARLQDAQQQIQTLEADYKQSAEQLAEAQKIKREQEKLNADLHLTRGKIESAKRDADVVIPELDESRPAAKALERMTLDLERWTDYASLASYNPQPRLQGTKAELSDELDSNLKTESELSKQYTKLVYQIDSLYKQINHDLSCPTCNRAWDDVAQREAHNAQIESEMEELEAESNQVKAKQIQVSKSVSILRAAVNHAVPMPSENSNWLQVSDGMYPPVFEWTGEIPQQVNQADLKAAQRAANEEVLEFERCERLKERAKQAADELVKLQTIEADLNTQLNNLGSSDSYSDLRLKVNDLQHKLEHWQRESQDAQRQLDNLDQLTAHLFTEYEDTQKNLSRLYKEFVEADAKLNDTKLNNNLLKTLRTVKPQVADKIWETVCSTISHYFSQMRSQQSIIAKGSNGFTVDGKDTQSLSGSTLDILGIAIRIALTKTFMPDARFLLLDEPFAACDAQRQSQALGFITSAGFEQVVVVTHEDTSEVIADHVIEL